MVVFWSTRLGCFVSVLLPLVLFSSTALAQDDRFWDGSKNTSWNDNQNWSPRTNVPNKDSEVAVFDTATANDPAAYANAITIGGFRLTGGEARTLTFDSAIDLGQYGVDNSSTYLLTIAAGASGSTVLTAEQTWSITNTGGTLFCKNVANGGFVLGLEATNAGVGTITGVVSGTGGISMSGSGTWTLTGANTYTGVTTITGGILSVATIGNGGVAGNLGQASNAAGNLVLSGGTLQYTGATASTNRNFTLSAGTTSTFDITSNNLTISGAGGASSGGLTKRGAGTLTLTGDNAYTGTTTVTEGTLSLARSGGTLSGAVTVNGGTLNVAQSDTVGAVTLSSGTISGTGTLTGTVYNLTNTGSVSAILGGTADLNKTGAGTVFLSGANTYTGVTTFTQGIVNVATLSNFGVAGSLGMRAVDVSPPTSNVGLHFMGGTLQYTGATAQSTNRDIRVGLAGATIDASGSNPAATMSFTKSTPNVDIWDTDGARTLTLTGSNTGDNTFAINWQERAAGHSNIVKSGAGTWVLTNSHNSDAQSNAYNAYGGYGGGTILVGGTLGFTNNAIGGGVVDFTGNATLRWQPGNTQDITTGSGAGVARSVKIEDGVTATFNTYGNNVTLSNAFTVGPLKTGAVTKDGAGILTLIAANTYTGGTTVSAGTLVLNGNQTAATGAVSVFGTLSGTGTVGGITTINSGGTHAPGAVGAVGRQDFSSSINYAAGSIFEWDLNTNSTANPGGTAFDTVSAGGNVTVNPSNTVFKIVFGASVNMSDPFWNTQFVTRKWAMSSIFGAAISGSFQTVDTGSYAVNPIGHFSIDGNYLYYTTVPEPTSALVGLLLAAGLLRRKR